MEKKKMSWITQEQNPELRAQVYSPNQEELISDKWKWDVRQKNYKRFLKSYYNSDNSYQTRK